MKYRVKYILILLTIGLLCMSDKAEAGLNSNELELADYFEGGIVYDGKHYSIPIQYINQGINYMKQSNVEITDNQKAKIYGMVVNMTIEGIQKGYLILDESTPNKEDASTTTAETDTTQPSSPTLITDPTVTPGIVPTAINNSSVSGGKLSVNEMIASGKSLLDDLGVKVAYDSEQNKISVVNEKGKTVMLADKVIKNTGFLLNQTFIILFGLFTLLVICIQVARRHQLFAHYDES